MYIYEAPIRVHNGWFANACLHINMYKCVFVYKKVFIYTYINVPVTDIGRAPALYIYYTYEQIGGPNMINIQYNIHTNKYVYPIEHTHAQIFVPYYIYISTYADTCYRV